MWTTGCSLPHLWTSHLGVIRKGGQYCSTTDLVVSIRGSPLAMASLERAYCLARYLEKGCVGTTNEDWLLPAGLVDNSSQVADVVSGELAPDGWQTDPVAGGEEGLVDRLVGDAGVLTVELDGGPAEHVVGVVEEAGLGGAGDDEGTARGGRGGGVAAGELQM